MQNHYGSAIWSSKRKLDQMHDAMQAILKLILQDEGKSLEEQHALCPKDNLTWCKFWQAENKQNRDILKNIGSHTFSSMF